MKRIKVIARTTDDRVYLVREGKREYLELEHRIPSSAFPHVRRYTQCGRDKIARDVSLDIPLSDNVAYNSELYPKQDCIRL